MAGVHNGCAVLITKEYPIYFHYASHRLNLSVQNLHSPYGVEYYGHCETNFVHS